MHKDPEARRAYARKYRKNNQALIAAIQKRWRELHPEKAAAMNRRWRKQNPDRIKLHKKKWEAANPDKVFAQRKRNRKNSADKIRLRNRAYQQNNKDKTKVWRDRCRSKNPQRTRDQGRIYRANRRAAESAGQGLSHDLAPRLLVSQKSICAYCPTDLRVTGYHMDHIIPLKKGGRHEDANIALACPPCNLSKWARDPEEFRLYRCEKAG